MVSPGLCGGSDTIIELSHSQSASVRPPRSGVLCTTTFCSSDRLVWRNNFICSSYPSSASTSAALNLSRTAAPAHADALNERTRKCASGWNASSPKQCGALTTLLVASSSSPDVSFSCPSIRASTSSEVSPFACKGLPLGMVTLLTARQRSVNFSALRPSKTVTLRTFSTRDGAGAGSKPELSGENLVWDDPERAIFKRSHTDAAWRLAQQQLVRTEGVPHAVLTHKLLRHTIRSSHGDSIPSCLHDEEVKRWLALHVHSLVGGDSDELARALHIAENL